jgi:isopenicillin-N epimerase
VASLLRQPGLRPPEPLGADLAAFWALDPEVTFLNHGSFGAAPRPVLAAQAAWRERIEARPVELLDRRREEILRPSREAVARLIGCGPDDFGFVTNATGGVNAVLRSLPFGPGDEILATDHVYGAVRQTLRHVAAVTGASLAEARVPFPLRRADGSDVLEAIAAAITPRTRLLVVDHVTSPTAVVFPVARIAAACAERGVDVLVDGAHAPGMIDLDVPGLGAAYYAGNLHKWVCAPKGAAFLWVRADRRDRVHPNTISHFLGKGFAAEFAWQGTRDITAWLAARDAIAFMDGFGWPRVRAHNHALAAWAQAALCAQLGVAPASDAGGAMLGSMCTVALPAAVRERHAAPAALQAALYDRHRIEVPVVDWGGRWWIRASCQLYNAPEQYERLAQAVMHP